MEWKFSKPVSIPLRIIIISCSAYFIFKAFHLLSNDPEVLGKYSPYKLFIWSHIVGGMTALALGPFLLWQPRRDRYLRLHRLLGKVYVGGVMAGSAGAMVLAVTTTLTVGWSYTFSLHALGFAWLSTTLLAWFAAVQKLKEIHRQWMTYSYMATVAFVFQALIFETSILTPLGSFAEIYPSVIWASWVIPFLVYTQWLSVVAVLKKREERKR
ncbi:MAG TPA: DUF2306 domain-containing protein [Chryseolinea sp.]